VVDVPVTERLRRLSLIIWASIGGLILLSVFLWVASQVRIIWLPLAFAGGLVILLDPIVRSLERVAIHRVFGTFFAFIVLASFVVAVGFLVVPTIQEQAADFGTRLPVLYDETVIWLSDTARELGFNPGPVWTAETIREWIQDPVNQSAMQSLLGGFSSGAGVLIRGVAEVVAVVALAPVLAFYLLIDLPRSRRLFLELTPPRLREEVSYVSSQVGRALGAFVRGQLLVALIVGVLSSIGLWLLELPFWLIIGMAAGFLNMVPFIGPVFGGVLAVVVALVEGDPTKALLAVLIFVGIQQLDNHVVTPMVQRARVKLSPLVIVLALIVGGSVAGLLGVLIAVPIVSVARIVAGHVWRTRVLGESWEEASEAMIEVTEPSERLRPRRRPLNQPKLFDTAELPKVDDLDQGQVGEAVAQAEPERHLR